MWKVRKSFLNEALMKVILSRVKKVGKANINVLIIYDGQFEDNNINGKGIFTWRDRSQYIGDWKII